MVYPEIDLQSLFLTAKAFKVKKDEVLNSASYSVEFVILAGLKHLLGLKKYYETHSVVSQKAKLDKLKQIIKDLGGDPEQAIKDLGGDPKQAIKDLGGDPKQAIKDLGGDPEEYLAKM